MNWMPVYGSSNVSSIGYDIPRRECWVRFHSGATYVYENVSPEVYDEFLHSGSKGRFVKIQMARAYNYRQEADYIPETGEVKPDETGTA